MLELINGELHIVNPKYSSFKRTEEAVSTDDKDEILCDSPHYSQSFFNEARTIFGGAEEGLTYVYSDRLHQWDYKKHQAAVEQATFSGYVKRTANWYEAYLSAYFGKDIEICHILAGVNMSNGYPYQVFGYR